MKIVFSMSATLSDRALQDILAKKSAGIRVLASRKLSNTNYLFAVANEDGDYVVSRATLRQAGLVSNKFTLNKIEALATKQTLYEVQKFMDKFVGAGKSLSAPPPLYSLIYPLSDLGVDLTPDLDDKLRDWQEKFNDLLPMRWIATDPTRQTVEICLNDPSKQDEQQNLEDKNEVFICLRNYLIYRK